MGLLSMGLNIHIELHLLMRELYQKGKYFHFLKYGNIVYNQTLLNKVLPHLDDGSSTDVIHQILVDAGLVK